MRLGGDLMGRLTMKVKVLKFVKQFLFYAISGGIVLKWFLKELALGSCLFVLLVIVAGGVGLLYSWCRQQDQQQ